MRSILPPGVLCAVCGQPAAGWHFGAITCRACAAFFRRSWDSKRTKTCKKGEKKCEVIVKNGFFNCKKCRLQKCFAVGMVAEYFQTEQSKNNNELLKVKHEIVPTINTFLGQPNLIIFKVPEHNENGRQLKIIDVNYLIDKAAFILNQSVESPIHSTTSLGNLGVGIRQVRSSSQVPDFRMWNKFGKEEMLALWEHEFLRLTKWLTYFEAFRQLPQCMQMTMAKNIWAVWSRLARLADTASKIRTRLGETEVKKMKKDELVLDWSYVKMDMSWCSDYPLEQIRLFLDIPTQCRFDDLLRMMVELDPTDVELAYMLCQLSFDHIGRRNQGEMSEIVEKFQENLADDLHQYYVEELKKPRYSERLANMMKINNRIQQIIRANRTKVELAIVFEVMNCECSHPEMFMYM